MAYRNPSPPPEVDSPSEEDKDRISETVLSKSWLLSVMIKVVEDKRHRRPCKEQAPPRAPQLPNDQQTADCKDGKDEENSQQVLHPHNNDSHNSDDEDVNVMELDTELEDDLCKLWDASINEDVAVFLHEHNGGPLLLHVSLQSMSPRLSEICIGIVANLVCHQSIANDISKDEETVLQICDSFFSSDPATLLESSRLVLTCLSYPSIQHHWISTMDTTAVREQLLFILTSSTHDELVAKVLQVIEKLMDVSQQLLDTWSTPELVSAVHEASSLASSSSDLSHHLMLLQLISTTLNGVNALSKCKTEVIGVLRKYFSLVVEEEDCEISMTETKAYEIAAALSTLNILLENGCDRSELSDFTEIQQVLQLIQPKKSVEHTTQDKVKCKGLESVVETDITLILKENVNNLMKKLK